MGNYGCELALLIDNNATDNYENKQAIIQSGLARDVKVMTSGIAAINYLKEENQQTPKLIFFDFQIPLQRGQVFLYEYASLPIKKRDQIKIVALAPGDRVSQIEKLLTNDEVSGVESKPLTKEVFSRIMARS